MSNSQINEEAEIEKLVNQEGSGILWV